MKARPAYALMAAVALVLGVAPPAVAQVAPPEGETARLEARLRQLEAQVAELARASPPLPRLGPGSTRPRPRRTSRSRRSSGRGSSSSRPTTSSSSSSTTSPRSTSASSSRAARTRSKRHLRHPPAVVHLQRPADETVRVSTPRSAAGVRRRQPARRLPELPLRRPPPVQDRPVLRPVHLRVLRDPDPRADHPRVVALLQQLRAQPRPRHDGLGPARSSKRFDYAVGIFNGTKNAFVDTNDAKDFIGFLNAKPFREAGIPALENLNVGGSVDVGSQDQRPDTRQTLRTHRRRSRATRRSASRS